MLEIETEIDHSAGIELTMDKTLDLTIGDNYKIDVHIMDMTIGNEAIDAKIMELRDNRDRGIDRVNFRRDFSNDRNSSRDRNRRRRERSLTPRRDDRKYHSPNANLGTRNRSTSRVTMNRDRIRCYKCREYDHFANECQTQSQMIQMVMNQTELHYS